MSANILFINEALLKSRTGISNAIDGNNIKPQIKVAQDIYIQPALGSTLYLRLQDGIDNNNLTAIESDLLDSFITDCLVWYTMSLLPIALGYQFFSKGVLQKTSEESNTPSRGDLELISNSYKATAEFYKQRLINHLRQNYTSFSQYYNQGIGLDIIFPESKAYTCPIYLGDYSYVSSFNNATTGSGVLSLPITIYITPSTGVSTFEVSQISGKTLILATRSGFVKGVTSSVNANTLYLQIVGTTVTLPTGDLTQADEVFSFTYR
jgi:hypothetical protein